MTDLFVVIDVTRRAIRRGDSYRKYCLCIVYDQGKMAEARERIGGKRDESVGCCCFFLRFFPPAVTSLRSRDDV